MSGLDHLRELAERCPTCGSLVSVHTTGEGTSSYVPLPADELIQIAEAARGVRVLHRPELDTDPNSPADTTGRHAPDCEGCQLDSALAALDRKLDSLKGQR